MSVIHIVKYLGMSLPILAMFVEIYVRVFIHSKSFPVHLQDLILLNSCYTIREGVRAKIRRVTFKMIIIIDITILTNVLCSCIGTNINDKEKNSVKGVYKGLQQENYCIPIGRKLTKFKPLADRCPDWPLSLG